MSDTKPREWWIFKGESKFADKLVPDFDSEAEVKYAPDSFYDLVSPGDTIEGGIHVIEKSAYDAVITERDRYRVVLEKIALDEDCDSGYTCPYAYLAREALK